MGTDECFALIHLAYYRGHARSALRESQSEPDKHGDSKALADGVAAVPDKCNDTSAATNKTFRDFYMECYTDAFGEELNKMREGDSGESLRVDFLVQCIEVRKYNINV